LFVWKDKQIKEKWNAICPQFNYMVINDDATEHLVTIVSPLAPENRITIQIRGF
jgi:hypothetical protein